MKYNGWTNYETWCVALHLANSFNYSFESPEDLKRFVEEWLCIHEDENLLRSDLMEYVLQQVNWEEVYKAWTEE